MSGASDRNRNAAAMLVDTHIAATNGNRHALAYRDKTYTFHDLAALVNRAGNMLRTAGVERGGRVMILLSPSPALMGVMLGAIKIGAVAIVSDDFSDPAKIRAACEKHRPALAVVDGARLDSLRASLGATGLIVAGETRDDLPALLDLLRASPSSLAAENVEGAEPALLMITGERTVSVTHAELAREAGGPAALALRLGSLDLSAVLASLAACAEVSIPAG